MRRVQMVVAVGGERGRLGRLDRSVVGREQAGDHFAEILDRTDHRLGLPASLRVAG